MLIAVLIYLLIGSLLVGGIYLVDPEAFIVDLDDIFFTRYHTINRINGFIIFLIFAMIWLPVFTAVIIKVIADKFN